jgi:hypothetical protein
MPKAARGCGVRAAAMSEFPSNCKSRAVASPIPELPPINKIVRAILEGEERCPTVKGGFGTEITKQTKKINKSQGFCRY